MSEAPTTDRRTRPRPATLVTWCATGAWATLIFMMSARPGSQIPGRFSEAAHFTEYLIFGMLLYAALRMSGLRRAAFLALALASAYGVTDEIHQAFVPQRTPDPMDWVVDTLGASVGVISASLAATRAKVALAERRNRPAQ
jgi:VanZ family protein